MKAKNQFNSLPETDQKFILHLCDNHHYAKVVEILAQPRPTGLNMVTSTSALCRFYTTHHQHAALLIMASQFGHALQIRRQSAPGACLTGILALLEHRVLTALKEGQPTSDLAPDIRLLKTVHTAFLAEEKARTQNAKFNSSYEEFVKDLADSPEPDYLRADFPNDPGAPGLDPGDFASWDIDEGEIDFQRMVDRQNRKAREQPREVLRRAAEPAATTPLNSPIIPHIPANPTPQNSTPPNPGPALNLPAANPFIEKLSTMEPPKSPAIPQIPPISTTDIPPTTSPFLPPAAENENAA